MQNWTTLSLFLYFFVNTKLSCLYVCVGREREREWIRGLIVILVNCKKEDIREGRGC